jgi:hypothetical protein
MGEVYLAEHPRLPRHDALKVLPADVSADSDFRSRFNLEADLAATLFHPHIVGVHDRGDFEGQLWIAMDYVEGTDAAQLMKAHYPARMPIEDVCAIVTAVADALDYAHKRGLLHRDVKPANILLAEPEDGKRRILLADFGIARPLADISGLTATNFTVGTLTYAAPEQLMGGDIDGRADQYALAATAFHLLTGAPPYQHSNPVAVISQHLNAASPKLSDRRPELAHLDQVLSKALAKDPTHRFDRCRDFATKLSERAAFDAESDRGTEAGPTVAAHATGSSSALPFLVDRLDDCARTDLPVGEDVGAQAPPVDQAAEHALRGEAFQVGTRLTQALAQALDVSDTKPTSDQSVQVDPASHDIATRLDVLNVAAAGQHQLVKDFGCDEREVVAVCVAACGALGQQAHRPGRSERSCFRRVAVSVEPSASQSPRPFHLAHWGSRLFCHRDRFDSAAQ